MLIGQPGSDYQLTTITLDAGRARDITCLLLDIHAVLDQLHLDGTRPEITSTAEAILRESDSPYTLPGLISALDEVIWSTPGLVETRFSPDALVWVALSSTVPPSGGTVGLIIFRFCFIEHLSSYAVHLPA